MLQVTHKATAVLKDARAQIGAPPEVGVRVRAEESAEHKPVVQLSFQRDPEPTDQKLELPGLRVFVAQELVEPLADRILDVRTTPQGARLMLR